MTEDLRMSISGIGGEVYDFTPHAIQFINAPSEPGVFVVAALEIAQWRMILTGEMDNLHQGLSKGLGSLPMSEALMAAGATHVGTLIASGPPAHRVSIEKDIRLKHPELLNYKQGLAASLATR